MKYKVAALEGALLDAVVAMAEGIDVMETGIHFRPSTSWDIAGGIIDRERIAIYSSAPGMWEAGPSLALEASGMGISFCGNGQSGPTPLIAAMRAFVFRKLGEEVEL